MPTLLIKTKKREAAQRAASRFFVFSVWYDGDRWF